MSESRYVPVAGSARSAALNAEASGELDTTSRVEVTVLVRRRADIPSDLVQGPDTISLDELSARYGAHPDDLDLVRRVLIDQGLEVVSSDPASRQVVVSGTIAQLSTAFNTRLVQVASEHNGGQVTHRQREGELSVPAELGDVVTGVFGLDDRPQAHTRVRMNADAAGSTASYTPPQLGKIYGFPAGTDGTGQYIGIVELGGGFGPDDLKNYFQGLGLPVPKVDAVGVDGGKNQPGKDPNGADGEVLLDIEVVGGLAPGAHQRVYFAPNTDRGFVDAVYAAVHANPTPASVSISWGQYEDAWTAQARKAFDDAVAAGAALGVTVTAAAGDNGSGDGAKDLKAHADFPASSPHILACGGTKLEADPNSGKVSSEVVWNGGILGGATGGGVSTAFGLPDWQKNVGVPAHAHSSKTGRGVPDVAAVADPATGYQVLVDGKRAVYGGTSAVAPLWAALIARLAQATGKKFGLMQAILYKGVTKGKVAPGFRDVTKGNNGDYKAGSGWDACTGLGVPDGNALLDIIRKL